MSRILILGGYGFMGKNLNDIFKNSEHEIFNESIRTGCDIRIYDSIFKRLDSIKPDIIINAAAHVGSISYVSKYSAEVVHDNTLMYVNLYKSVAESNRNIVIINPISNCSYPGIIDVQHEENWWDGEVHESIEAYGVPKKMGYIISECYRRQYGIKTVNLIVSNAYGVNDHLDEQRTHAMSGIIMRMIKAQLNGDKDFVVWGSGKPIREWVYMPDVARLIKQIIDNEKFDDIPNPINVGQENGISIIESVNMIKNFLNYDVNIITDLTKQDGAPIKVLGKKKFVEVFPEFQFTGFPEGINNTINYYKSLIK